MTRVIMGDPDAINGRRRSSYIAKLPHSQREMLEQFAKVVAEYYYDREMLDFCRQSYKNAEKEFLLDEESILLNEMQNEIDDLAAQTSAGRNSVRIFTELVRTQLAINGQMTYNSMPDLMNNGTFVTYVAPPGMFSEDPEGFVFWYKDRAVYIEFVN